MELVWSWGQGRCRDGAESRRESKESGASATNVKVFSRLLRAPCRRTAPLVQGCLGLGVFFSPGPCSGADTDGKRETDSDVRQDRLRGARLLVTEF